MFRLARLVHVQCAAFLHSFQTKPSPAVTHTSPCPGPLTGDTPDPRLRSPRLQPISGAPEPALRPATIITAKAEGLPPAPEPILTKWPPAALSADGRKGRDAGPLPTPDRRGLGDRRPDGWQGLRYPGRAVSSASVNQVQQSPPVIGPDGHYLSYLTPAATPLTTPVTCPVSTKPLPFPDPSHYPIPSTKPAISPVPPPPRPSHHLSP